MPRTPPRRTARPVSATRRKPGPAARHRLRPAPPAKRVAASSGTAPGMQAISAYLAVANVGATAEFLERAFGFARGVVLSDPDGHPRYAEMRQGQSTVMLVRKGDATAPGSGIPALYAYVEDVDRQLAAAREAGAGVEGAEDKPWGDRVGVVTDPDGYRWVLATFKKLVPFT